MDTQLIDAVISSMTPEEVRDGLRMVSLFERWGSMSQAEADEWRRRIAAWEQFLAMDSPSLGMTS